MYTLILYHSVASVLILLIHHEPPCHMLLHCAVPHYAAAPVIQIRSLSETKICICSEAESFKILLLFFLLVILDYLRFMPVGILLGHGLCSVKQKHKLVNLVLPYHQTR